MLARIHSSIPSSPFWLNTLKCLSLAVAVQFAFSTSRQPCSAGACRKDSGRPAGTGWRAALVWTAATRPVLACITTANADMQRRPAVRFSAQQGQGSPCCSQLGHSGHAGCSGSGHCGHAGCSGHAACSGSGHSGHGVHAASCLGHTAAALRCEETWVPSKKPPCSKGPSVRGGAATHDSCGAPPPPPRDSGCAPARGLPPPRRAPLGWVSVLVPPPASSSRSAAIESVGELSCPGRLTKCARRTPGGRLLGGTRQAHLDACTAAPLRSAPPQGQLQASWAESGEPRCI